MFLHLRRRKNGLAIILWCLFIFGTPLYGCWSQGYGISIRFSDPQLADDAAAVKIDLLPECPAPIQEIDDLENAHLSMSFRRSEPSPSLGRVPPGSYGLRARVQDASCTIIAAGCTTVELEAGGKETLVVVVETSTSGVGTTCDPEAEVCQSGLCEAGDGDADADADTDTDADADMDVDTDADTDADGDADSDSDADVDGEPLLHFGGHFHSPGVTVANLYVDDDGNAENTGLSPEDALPTINQALEMASPGDDIAVLDGTYYDTEVSVEYVTIINFAGHHPILTSTGEGSQPKGIFINANGVNIQGFEVMGCSFIGVSVHRADDVVVRYVTAHDNGNRGISAYEAMRPLFEYCVAYRNYSPEHHGDEGTGITIGFDSQGGVIRYCVSYNNSDSGYGFWQAIDTTIEHSIAFGNGFNRWDDSAFDGSGNGFIFSNSSGTTFNNVVSYSNAHEGLDSGGGDEAMIERCTAYDNGSYGIFITPESDSTTVRNTISFDHETDINDEGTGTSYESNSWSGFDVTVDDFRSLSSPLEEEYRQDGYAAIESSEFLHLAAGSDLIGSGVDGYDLGAFPAE